MGAIRGVRRRYSEQYHSLSRHNLKILIAMNEEAYAFKRRRFSTQTVKPGSPAQGPSISPHRSDDPGAPCFPLWVPLPGFAQCGVLRSDRGHGADAQWFLLSKTPSALGAGGLRGGTRRCGSGHGCGGATGSLPPGRRDFSLKCLLLEACQRRKSGGGHTATSPVTLCAVTPTDAGVQ